MSKEQESKKYKRKFTPPKTIVPKEVTSNTACWESTLDIARETGKAHGVILRSVKVRLNRKGNNYKAILSEYTGNNNQKSPYYWVDLSLAENLKEVPSLVRDKKTVTDYLIQRNVNVRLSSKIFTLPKDPNMEWICLSCGHVWSYPFSTIKINIENEGKGVHNPCPECGKHKRWSIRRIKTWLLTRPKYKNISIISTEYTQNKDELEWACSKCDKTFHLSIFNIQQYKYPCPNCRETVHGWYTPHKARVNKEEWENVYAEVYTLKCWDKSTEEVFYKIGLTQLGAEERFKYPCHLPYEYKVLHRIKTNLYEACFIEDKLHKKYSHNHYLPLKPFGGSLLECFSELKEKEDFYNYVIDKDNRLG